MCCTLVVFGFGSENYFLLMRNGLGVVVRGGDFGGTIFWFLDSLVRVFNRLQRQGTLLGSVFGHSLVTTFLKVI
jgi:hypothetical protein